jgi:AcrR family transcriptional regulator
MMTEQPDPLDVLAEEIDRYRQGVAEWNAYRRDAIARAIRAGLPMSAIAARAGVHRATLYRWLGPDD